MMIVQGLLVGLVYYVCDLLSLAWWCQSDGEPSDCTGAAGWSGSRRFAAGILIGASVELIFLGVASIGATMPANAALGGTIATAFVIILTGADMEVALALAVLRLGCLAYSRTNCAN